MFESLSEKLQDVFARLGRKGRLTEADVGEALKEVRVALLGADVNFRVVKSFVAAVRERAVGDEVLRSLTPAQHVVKIVNEQLVETLGGGAARLSMASNPPTVVMLVGLQGSGKTTTAGKLAGLLKKQGQRPLLVACDPYRPAAIRQLQTLGQQLGVPVFTNERQQPPELAQAAVKEAHNQGLNYVILDTAGRLHIDDSLMNELNDMKRRVDPDEVLFVADAMTGQVVVQVAETFNQRVGISGVVLTKMDGDARGGAALSLRSVIGVPIKFVGVSEKLDGLEQFYPDRIASRILGMGDVLSLIERAQENVDHDRARALEKKIRSASFDLEDMLEQLSMVKRMGPLEQILGMIPGMSRVLKGDQALSFEDKQFKRMEAIILSMTKEERRHPEIIGRSRKKRIATGSGTNQAEINQLLNQFKQMQQFLKQMSAQTGKKKGMKQLRNMPNLGAGWPPGLR
ncbi:MAG: signal recognition particle protein [Chloroflexi bacterium]|nr:signal recognition particle protein [Chloroflexota bacterium]